MNPKTNVSCERFPCSDVLHGCYAVPDIDLDPEKISIVLISEATPADPADYYYSAGEPLFQQTTLLAFRDAGADVESFPDLLEMGVYTTSAVKCGKTGYGIKAATIEECSRLLEKELALFPNVKVFLLMGDVAIRAVNFISRRAGQGRVISAGSTYKIRAAEYFFQGRRAFPSYLQAGSSFFIEKSKRRMIADDIGSAILLAM